jgi:molybdate transport system substrate-binding protein
VVPVKAPLILAGLAAASIASAQSVPADDLVILSAAAVRPALIQVPPLFAQKSGHRLTVSFGNATAIQNKVLAGDRADVVILPPPQLVGLIRSGALVDGATAELGVVRLGIAAKAGAAKPPVATPEQFKQALLAAATFGMPDPADGSTSSLYIVKLLEQLGIAPQMPAKTTLFPDGTKALEAVAKGEIALTVAPITSIYVVPGVELVGPLPEALQLKTVYAASLVRTSAGSEAARALMTTLKSPEVAALLKQKGIDPP